MQTLILVDSIEFGYFLLLLCTIKLNWKYSLRGNPSLFEPVQRKVTIDVFVILWVFVSYFDENFTRCTAIKPKHAALSKMYIFCLKFKFTKFGALVKKTSTFQTHQLPLFLASFLCIEFYKIVYFEKTWLMSENWRKTL